LLVTNQSPNVANIAKTIKGKWGRTFM
jgi:hypothetical protein